MARKMLYLTVIIASMLAVAACSHPSTSGAGNLQGVPAAAPATSAPAVTPSAPTPATPVTPAPASPVAPTVTAKASAPATPVKLPPITVILPKQCAGSAIPTVGIEDGADGTEVQPIVLTNDSTSTCALIGRPVVGLVKKVVNTFVNLNPTENPIPTSDGKLGSGPTLITLAPSATAVFYIMYSQIPSGTQTCDTATGTEIRVAGGPNIGLPLGFPFCGGAIEVSNIMAS